MDKPIPEYLKLHREEVDDAAPIELQELAEAPCMIALRQAFERSTGWRMRLAGPDVRFRSALGQADDASAPLIDAAGDLTGRLVVEPAERLLACVRDESLEPQHEPDTLRTGANLGRLPLDRIAPLVESLAGVISEWGRAQRALWHREAELAAGVPVAARPNDSYHLAERLESVLRAGAQSVGGQAAALYLLDDATSELKMRSCWGLPKTRLLEPARPLRGCVADLEALIGHAVVLEDVDWLPGWHPPEDFPAAVCVPVSSPHTPLGTLWVFSGKPRDFSDHQTHMLEVVAGRIAADLEREMLLVEGVRSRGLSQQLSAMSQWQRSRLPSIKPLLDDWQFGSAIEKGDDVRRQFHDWNVAPNGLLTVAVGKSEGDTLAAALTSASVHGAWKSLSAQATDASRALNRLNETVWTSGSGDQFASLFIGMIHPERNWMEWSSAGDVQGVLVRGSAHRHFKPSGPALGIDPDAHFRRNRLRLHSGDVAVLFAGLSSEGDGMRELSKGIAREVRRSRRCSADSLANRLHAMSIEKRASNSPDESTLLVIRRR